MSTSVSDETDRVWRHTPAGIKAELSSLSARTKLMPFGYKAELSSLSAQTKLMPLGYNKRIDAETDIILPRYNGASREVLSRRFCSYS
ncbi:hypothetical protein [Candidatus Methylobacter oryzae]|uniref:Uncharacterized protein n=1 Tax=Candidatus Methylobacter oryzae TaxID=2497749 RepID=A0ABY3CDT5_9GAMM|nr:hypothetical protein [Candidatus Methylobacter oryzae]TRX00898.1 hypothetical protein EKO24_004660 [Candidatus Methylobacter oryzae]